MEKFVNRELFWKPRAWVGGGGGDGGCTPVSDPITLPFMGENTSDVEALQLLSLSPLPPPRRRNT